jgi:hypothetical protein
MRSPFNASRQASTWSRPPQSSAWTRNRSAADSSIEELLIHYSVVLMAHIVTTDGTGRLVHKGIIVLMPFPAANLDAAVFDERRTSMHSHVVSSCCDRMGERHVSFEPGIDRCTDFRFSGLGLRVLLQSSAARTIDVHRTDTGAATRAGDQVHGQRTCRVRCLTVVG